MVGKPDSLGFTGKPPPSTFNYRWDTAQLFASKYRLVLPSEDELRQELERDRQAIEARAESDNAEDNTE